MDFGEGVKTDAQLTYPAIGNGSFPGILLITGSGAEDMNETAERYRVLRIQCTIQIMTPR